MKITQQSQINELSWSKVDNLMPCIVQDQFSGEVLMQGYMSPEALEKSLETGLVTFYSRSKSRLWTKGESSNHTLEWSSIAADCDLDSLLVLAKPNGPTCHTGSTTCWSESESPSVAELAALTRTIQSRAKESNTEKSYTASLLESGVRRCAQKVGEEGVEVALAAVAQDDQALLNESADLIYHLLVVLEARELSLADVINVLKARKGSN
ncbi:MULTISPECIES: bifunctional phosphoribosyl-AMP cyclohydrolase/phosphoribosyl-ATP diphosphatase HisIE [Gammaproteobacteria]|uniref:bifunctional phosphoribosyl-AMP cyclohydrolase/phosphoribosyl-ATP diphosphatase HisIE n=1 Tax=Gammaproteobacteria TaxID=1236 RepID=UPI000DCFCFE1|nr:MULTISPECIES: bifunctional phosphoribosyl-AMP cyclohydrolase/phosphoribosyl-ATP diphosphatase HisIE [Gammaproteobacteria]RTE87621.1 bifunctional phosphoribosyl-AMP cyclohydrolase/phosphoribosyl-ATP diphosphatase HisIE [Aliidiomarina sp. B3213]TCZ92594.1 bifunctional phosphoribosyl-AMP cyclohydrolase/phosphoribosyl-ATP diphosphatase HisIE [Lysobacter sp. N42]